MAQKFFTVHTNVNYVVHMERGIRVCADLKEALYVLEKDEGYMIRSRTKNLFPSHKILWEREELGIINLIIPK